LNCTTCASNEGLHVQVWTGVQFDAPTACCWL